MLIQGQLCPTNFGNTGVGNCGFDLEQLEGFILMDKSISYTEGTYATQAALFTALQTAALQTVKTSRIYPYFGVAGAVGATGDNTNKESAYGATVDVFHERIRVTVTLDERGIRQLGNFAKFEGNKNLSVVMVFKGKQANSVMLFERNSSAALVGLECNVWANKADFAGKNKADKTITIELKNNDIFYAGNNSLVFWQLEAGAKLSRNLHGVHDLELYATRAATATKIYVGVKNRATGEIMGENFSTAMIQAGYFLLNLASTGASVSQTAAWDNITKDFTLTGTFTTAAHWLSTAAPSVAAALSTPFGNGITGGYEAEPISITPA